MGITTASFGGGGTTVSRRNIKVDTTISPLEQRVLDGELTIEEANRIANASFDQSSVTPGTLGQEVGTTTDIASDSGPNFIPNESPTSPASPTSQSVTPARTSPSTRPYIWKPS